MKYPDLYLVRRPPELELSQAGGAFRGLSIRHLCHLVLPDEEVVADADPTTITQVVGNMLHNAAKFTRGGDDVTLSLTMLRGEAEICVRDTGAGIEPNLLESIFEPFVQAQQTRARAEGGLGSRW